MVTNHLTRREQEVLELIRLGLTNEEIAQRLGISLDGAKYHVSQILSKLGVATREEAAQQPAPLEPPRRRTWLVGIAGAGVTIAAAATIAVLAWGSARSGSGDEADDGYEYNGQGPFTRGPLARGIPRLHWRRASSSVLRVRVRHVCARGVLRRGRGHPPAAHRARRRGRQREPCAILLGGRRPPSRR